MLIVENPAIAARFLDQWTRLVAAGNAMPAPLVAHNSVPTTNDDITVYFAATNNEAEFKPVLDRIASAREGILFLMFMPGQSPLLDALLSRVQKNDIYVRGVVSQVTVSRNGTIGSVGGQVVKSGAPSQEFHDDVLLPAGVPASNDPSWAEAEFTVQEIRAAHLMAIVHSKAIVIDPFSDDATVVTGSHNFSVSASKKNDENLVIVSGNQKLAQAYALHVNGVYDHYSWRAFLGSGGDPDQIYKPLTGWAPGGARAQELEFWMAQPIQPQHTPATGGNSSRAPLNNAAAPKTRRGKAASGAGRTQTQPAQPRTKTPKSRKSAVKRKRRATKKRAAKKQAAKKRMRR
jgi:phosphatidylserine/phosphatidylglycerophosphate/cardiolipin synthase-like enzyme